MFKGWARFASAIGKLVDGKRKLETPIPDVRRMGFLFYCDKEYKKKMNRLTNSSEMCDMAMWMPDLLERGGRTM